MDPRLTVRPDLKLVVGDMLPTLLVVVPTGSGSSNDLAVNPKAALGVGSSAISSGQREIVTNSQLSASSQGTVVREQVLSINTSLGISVITILTGGSDFAAVVLAAVGTATSGDTRMSLNPVVVASHSMPANDVAAFVRALAVQTSTAEAVSGVTLHDVVDASTAHIGAAAQDSVLHALPAIAQSAVGLLVTGLSVRELPSTGSAQVGIVAIPTLTLANDFAGVVISAFGSTASAVVAHTAGVTSNLATGVEGIVVSQMGLLPVIGAAAGTAFLAVAQHGVAAAVQSPYAVITSDTASVSIQATGFASMADAASVASSMQRALDARGVAGTVSWAVVTSTGSTPSEPGLLTIDSKGPEVALLTVEFKVTLDTKSPTVTMSSGGADIQLDTFVPPITLVFVEDP